MILLAMIVVLTFFLSPDPVLQKTRAQLLDGIFTLLPNTCYFPVSGITCSNVKIAESGIELSFKNMVHPWTKRDRDLGMFTVSLDACPYRVAADRGLDYQEEEKFVFRNCTLGMIGSDFKTRMDVQFVEGRVEQGILRVRKGWVFGEVSY